MSSDDEYTFKVNANEEKIRQRWLRATGAICKELISMLPDTEGGDDVFKDRRAKEMIYAWKRDKSSPLEYSWEGLKNDLREMNLHDWLVSEDVTKNKKWWVVRAYAYHIMWMHRIRDG